MTATIDGNAPASPQQVVQAIESRPQPVELHMPVDVHREVQVVMANDLGKPKIPYVCRSRGVESINLTEVIKREGWTFS